MVGYCNYSLSGSFLKDQSSTRPLSLGSGQRSKLNASTAGEITCCKPIVKVDQLVMIIGSRTTLRCPAQPGKKHLECLLKPPSLIESTGPPRACSPQDSCFLFLLPFLAVELHIVVIIIPWTSGEVWILGLLLLPLNCEPPPSHINWVHPSPEQMRKNED